MCCIAFAAVRGFDPHRKSDSAAEEAMGEGTQLQSIDALLTSLMLLVGLFFASKVRSRSVVRWGSLVPDSETEV